MVGNTLHARYQKGGQRHAKHHDGEAVKRPFGKADLRPDHRVEQAHCNRVGGRTDQRAQPAHARGKGDAHRQRAGKAFALVRGDPAPCQHGKRHGHHDQRGGRVRNQHGKDRSGDHEGQQQSGLSATPADRIEDGQGKPSVQPGAFDGQSDEGAAQQQEQDGRVIGAGRIACVHHPGKRQNDERHQSCRGQRQGLGHPPGRHQNHQAGDDERFTVHSGRSWQENACQQRKRTHQKSNAFGCHVAAIPLISGANSLRSQGQSWRLSEF